jgi:hypothetical protein
MLGTVGPLEGRDKGNRLPVEFSAIGKAPSKAQRVCQFANEVLLKEVYKACRSDEFGREFEEEQPGAKLRKNRRERATFYTRGWDSIRNRQCPNSVILLDVTVMTERTTAGTIEKHFDLVPIPVEWRLRGFPGVSKFHVVTSARK